MYGPEKLKEIIRFEVNPDLFREDNEEDSFFNEENYHGSYKPNYHDLVAACNNMLNADANTEIVMNWYYFTHDDLADHYEGAFLPSTNLGYLWPNNDDDLFTAIDYALSDLTIFYDSSENIRDEITQIIQISENYIYNKEHDLIDWKLTSLQIENILEEFSESTDKVSNSRKELFKKIVNEECEKNNYLAMRIKGYGCYGGDKVFDCDWEESRKWITRLFETDGDPHYANSLGYIYYYGRCNNGIPDYEKAFQYFSVGAAHDLYESMYKIADMFLSGKGCIKSPETSEYIIYKLYLDSKPRFCSGEDANFADIALRWASKWQREEKYEIALYHYMEADFAIDRRLKKSDFFGDKKVKENITKSIEEVKSKLDPRFFSDEIVLDDPYWIFDMLQDDCNAKFEINHIEGNRYKIKVIRPKKDHIGKALIVSPNLGCIMLARSFETEFITDEPIIYDCKDKSNMYVNNIVDSYDNELCFCNGDVEIFKIKNARFILKKDDFIINELIKG